MESNKVDRARVRVDWLVGAALFVFAFVVYWRTLAPSVAFVFDDSLEFQLLASRMAIPHPTGYPLYAILIKLATFLPMGDAAYRVNLVSAVSGAGAVVFVYWASGPITSRFIQAENLLGSVLTRVPGVVAALTLAFGETFWSQAVVAEVYALQALFTAALLWLVLKWSSERTRGDASNVVRQPRERFHVSVLTIAFFAGLMLTHHRMSVLMYPALAVYVLTYERGLLKEPRTLLKMALVFLLPLLLYLYLPLRGMVTSSLDGAYRNTPEGFLNWVLGSAYTVFLSQNPFHETRDAGYFLNLVVNDLGAAGVVLAVVGMVALFLRVWREWLLLSLALVVNLAFVLTYRVADIDVFFIPSFVILALFIAAGVAGLVWLAYYGLSRRAAAVVVSAGAVLTLALPLALLRGGYPRVDLSNKRDVIDYGREVMTGALPHDATIVGILGEMSLLRYVQETEGVAPDVETVAADKEEDRRAAIDAAIARGRTVFVTRPLKGLEKDYALTSQGELIQVELTANRSSAPKPMHTLDADFGDVKLLGFDRTGRADGQEGVTLYWQAQKKIGEARLVSLKVIDAAGKLAGQVDRQPVRDAYPTNMWRNGEYIADRYDVPVFVGAEPGEYGLQVTLYDPSSGKVFGQEDLGRVTVELKTQPVARDLLGVPETVARDLGGVELSGYDLDVSEPFTAGEPVPLTLLWRMLQGGAAREYEVVVSDEFGKMVASQKASVSGAAGQYVRQELGLALPANLTRGKYMVRVTLSGGSFALQGNSYMLGTVEVRAQ